MQGVKDCRLNLKSFFFESKRLSTQNFDEDHHEYVKRENSVNSNYKEHNDDLFDEEKKLI